MYLQNRRTYASKTKTKSYEAFLHCNFIFYKINVTMCISVFGNPNYWTRLELSIVITPDTHSMSVFINVGVAGKFRLQFLCAFGQSVDAKAILSELERVYTVGIYQTNQFTENYGFSNLRTYFQCVYYSNAYCYIMECVKRGKCVPAISILFGS